MQIGMIGLGRMGRNIVRRPTRNGHQCVVFDQNPAMRLGFGGHIEGHDPIDREPKPNGSQNSPAAQHPAE